MSQSGFKTLLQHWIFSQLQQAVFASLCNLLSIYGSLCAHPYISGQTTEKCTKCFVFSQAKPRLSPLYMVSWDRK